MPATVDSTEDADEAEDQVVDVEHIVLDLLKGFAQVEVHQRNHIDYYAQHKEDLHQRHKRNE